MEDIMDREKEIEVDDFIGWCLSGTTADWTPIIVEGHEADVRYNGKHVLLSEKEIGISRFDPEYFYDRFRGKIHKPNEPKEIGQLWLD
jgi:hypothetical protein